MAFKGLDRSSSDLSEGAPSGRTPFVRPVATPSKRQVVPPEDEDDWLFQPTKRRTAPRNRCDLPLRGLETGRFPGDFI